MEVNPVAKTARAELGETITLAVHLYGLTAAVRALIQVCPNQSLVRDIYDQLETQMLTNPAFAISEEARVVLKDFTATLFQPPVVLDK